MTGLLKTELQVVADDVEIARPGMTIVLTQVVQLKSEMLVYLPGNADGDAIADPGVKWVSHFHYHRVVFAGSLLPRSREKC